MEERSECQSQRLEKTQVTLSSGCHRTAVLMDSKQLWFLPIFVIGLLLGRDTMINVT